MHIPDGYLSPQTCAVATVAMVPVWGNAARKVRSTVKRREIPLLALAASYSFLVMMLNVPIPDGTTAHAVGAVLIAVLLGPWAAVIAVSVALLIQALFFGDGGVLAFGANAFNMAFVMPFVGYGVYRLISGRVPLTSRRRVLAAGLGAYAGLNAAALCTAVEFGIQPDLFSSADGTPLYAPFHLAQTIPAMALAHLTVAGGVEAALTAGVVADLQRENLPVLRINRAARPPDESSVGQVSEPGEPECEPVAGDVELEPVGRRAEPVGRGRSAWAWAVAGIAVLALITPLGLLASGGAFGEGAPSDLDLGRYGLNAVPSGLDRYNRFWSHSLLGGYGFESGQNATLGYLLSAVVGIVVISLVVLLAWWAVRLVGRLRSAGAAGATGSVGPTGSAGSVASGSSDRPVVRTGAP
ncbi:MAG: cobalt transporter CbiM [Acidimicrobiales bacterium]